MEKATLRKLIDNLYQAESRRVLATLIRLLNGNFELAEEALHDAFLAALSQWQSDGVPENPRAWLVSAGRFKAIDRLRKVTRFDEAVPKLLIELEADDDEDAAIDDDQLRLIFTCCHPALSREAQVALTLREVCGLTTEAIAAAFLIPATTLAQRIVRAKNKIRDAGIPYVVPEQDELPERLEAVLQVVYLVFNESYTASSGPALIRCDLAVEAIRLGYLLKALLPGQAEVDGLLALMLLHDARREARSTAAGDLIPLDEQDRGLWKRDQIKEGSELVLSALRSRQFGAYTLQAAIAAVHAEAADPEQTDWHEVVGLYQALMRLSPSPVVELNFAVAIAMRDGPEAGLERIDAILARGELLEYHLLHAARADLFSRLNRADEALTAYQAALSFVRQEPERRFLERKIASLKK